MDPSRGDSPDGPGDLVARLARSRAGIFLDFDGTLAPIVDDPATSALPDGAESVLADLAARLPLVAVVSGRPVAFLAERVLAPGVRLLGLYGLEEWRDGAAVARPEAVAWQDAVDAASDELAAALVGVRGVVLEDKGLSVALHWRNAPDREAAQAAVERAVTTVAQRTGLAQEPGKLVTELRPPVEWDKGSAVRSVARELALADVAYVGDDRGDLPAFAAVAELGGLRVLVDAGDETPPELRAAADVVLAGTGAVLEALRDLAAALDPA